MSTKLFVGNLNFRTTEQALRDLFERDGLQVDQVTIVTDRETGRSRGFGFVQMNSQEDAQTAQSAFDGTELDGRPIRVNEAHERPQRSGGGGGGGRGGGGGGGGYRGGGRY